MRLKLRRWLYYYFSDHGLLRIFYSNLHRLPGNLYRSNQPSPRRLKILARRYGLKTVVNLRGGDSANPAWQLEQEACKKLGLTMVDLRLFSRSFPYVEDVTNLKQVIETIELPALVHCKSGADRAGLFCVFYRHYRLGQPIKTALTELGLKYGHIKWARTGTLDQFFLEFLRDRHLKKGQGLLEWVRNDYDRQYLKLTRPERGLIERLSNILLDKILRRE